MSHVQNSKEFLPCFLILQIHPVSKHGVKWLTWHKSENQLKTPV